MMIKHFHLFRENKLIYYNLLIYLILYIYYFIMLFLTPTDYDESIEEDNHPRVI